MTITFRPAVRTKTPVIIGIAGPSKSGKTYSALRMAVGLQNGGPIVMLNTEGPRGHLYSDKFKYTVGDIEPPFSADAYKDAVAEAGKLSPSVIIIDSVSHMWEGTGGILDAHEKELDRMAGADFKRREKLTFACWVRPKAAEAVMINELLRLECHVILCFRAKEKLKIVKGADPIDIGWQPICSDRLPFETLAMLILPAHARGVPDMSALGSDTREPIDTLIEPGEQISEDLGVRLKKWAAGSMSTPVKPSEELQDVLDKIEAMQTEEDRTSAIALAQYLQAGEKDIARKAYTEKYHSMELAKNAQ